MKKNTVATLLVLSATGVGVAVIATLRLSESPPEANAGGLATSPPSEPLRPQFTNTNKELEGTRYLRDETRRAFQAAIGAKLASFAGIDRAAQASGLLVQRAELIFDPDYERWSAYAGGLDRNARSGWVAPADPAFRERWETLSAAYRDPVIDPDNIWIESVDPFRDFPKTQPGTICLRNTSKYSAPYPFHVRAEDAAEAEAIEVFVPARIRDLSGKDLGVTISFVLVRERPGADWKEQSMFVYVGAEGFGRELSQPPF